MAIESSKRIHTSDALKKAEGSEVVLAGWAAEIKSLGKIAFVRLRDFKGEMQLMAKADFQKFNELVSLAKESVILVKGKVVASKLKSGEKELSIEDFEIISRSEPVLPIEFSDRIATSLDKRLDHRIVDLRNPKRLAIFKIRSTINAEIRKFLLDNDFVEIQTPKIISAGAEGGATLFPVVYYGKKAFLSQSQQLYKQSVLAAGLEKVFEIGPNFRAEKSHTTKHLSEFTQLDFEMSFIKDEEDVLKVLERLLVHVFGAVKKINGAELELLGRRLEVPKLPFQRITYDKAVGLLNKSGVKIKKGDDIGSDEEGALCKAVEEKYNTKFFFLTKFPFELKPFYIMTDGDVSRGFDLLFGEEIASGGQREHRYDVLVRQMKKKGLNPKDFEFYLESFRYGMPLHGGFGLGIDRLVKQVLGLENIREGVLFPRDPERLAP